jgi:hypothetical protein
MQPPDFPMPIPACRAWQKNVDLWRRGRFRGSGRQTLFVWQRSTGRELPTGLGGTRGDIGTSLNRHIMDKDTIFIGSLKKSVDNSRQ